MTAATALDFFHIKWPFGARAGNVPVVGLPRGKNAPLRAPIPSAPAEPIAQTSGPTAPLQSYSAQGVDHVGHSGLTRRQMVTDIVLVGVWGLMIPAMLWLGHVVGY